MLGGRRRVDKAARAAYEAWDTQDWDGAARLLRELVDVAEREGVDASTATGRKELAGWVFDLALAHKFRRDWEQARAAGRRAAALAPDGPGEPAWWNLGIAATALHDWPLAREAWTRYGVQLPPGDGPPDGDFGMTPVRIRTAEAPEVVWCRRLDPARARVVSVPLPGSGRRSGEIVLHDGVPNGHRVVDGVRHSVFDEILLWAESDLPVQSVRVRVASDADLTALRELGEAQGVSVEAWNTVVPLCAACSEGVVDHAEHAEHAEHQHEPGSDGLGRLDVGVAADRDRTDRLLRAWVAGSPARRGAGTPETVA